MKDIAIIVGYNRPEYMEVCLDLLLKADGFDQLKVYFALDFGYSRKNRSVIEARMQGRDFDYILNNGSRYKYMKQSFNVLESYRKAANETKQYVFLIEDDIFCAKSFFTSHYEIHQQFPNIFCSIGSHLQNAKELQNLEIDSNGVTKKSVYQSWGVCFKKNILNDFVLPLANPNYYRHGGKYLRVQFPNHFLNDQFSEQDGLIRRVHDTSGLEIGFPHYPRAFHAGVWGYHRQGENIRKWTHEEKVDFIYKTCFSQAKMQKYNQYNDVFITDLKV